MSVELALLFWSTTLIGAYVGVQGILYRVQHGIWFSASGRDDEPPPDKWTARASKALRNLLETYAAFVVLVLVIELAHRSDALTLWGAQLWFWSRWIYLPLYLFGVQWLRSLVWAVSAFGLGLMFLGILF
jgi:uncharacterized MAPEG superfamily protein